MGTAWAMGATGAVQGEAEAACGEFVAVAVGRSVGLRDAVAVVSGVAVVAEMPAGRTVSALVVGKAWAAGWEALLLPALLPASASTVVTSFLALRCPSLFPSLFPPL